jgi:hypothetical protein
MKAAALSLLPPEVTDPLAGAGILYACMKGRNNGLL